MTRKLNKKIARNRSQRQDLAYNRNELKEDPDETDARNNSMTIDSNNATNHVA